MGGACTSAAWTGPGSRSSVRSGRIGKKVPASASGTERPRNGVRFTYCLGKAQQEVNLTPFLSERSSGSRNRPGEPAGVLPAYLALANGKPCMKRSEEHTSELQSLMRISYAVFCLKKKKTTIK